MHAVGRIAYRGDIDNIQASWVKLGMGGLAQLLQAGVNDAGGTLMDENISRAAGASHGQSLDVDEVQRLVGSLGRTLRQRTTLYGTPEHEVAAAIATRIRYAIRLQGLRRAVRPPRAARLLAARRRARPPHGRDLRPLPAVASPGRSHPGGAAVARAPPGRRSPTRCSGTSVLTPTMRYHPSIVAQNFATLGCLFPDRIFLGVGTGEALNETPATAASGQAPSSGG